MTHLNISGCGLVSNQLLELLEEEEENADRAAKRPKMAFNQGQAPQTCLKSLIMLTYYEDTDQVETTVLNKYISVPAENIIFGAPTFLGGFGLNFHMTRHFYL